MKNIITILILIITFSSCDFFKSKEEKTELKQEVDYNIGLPKITQNKINYMNSLSMYDKELFKKTINNLPLRGNANRSVSVWGIGPDYRVYEWNGTSWAEPNPQARLKWVDVSVYGGGVWGVGADHRVYKWNGTSWAEPNPNAGLHNISAISGSIAIGLGDQGRLYLTMNGGVSWSRFTNIEKIRWTSVGNSTSNFFWGVDFNFNPIYFEFATNSWITKRAPAEVQKVSAMWTNGVWAIKNIRNEGSINLPNNIYKSIDGTNFIEPNNQAKLRMISAHGDDLTAWGIGENNRVFTTNNGGLSWSEPNPAAGLIHVSIGND